MGKRHKTAFSSIVNYRKYVSDGKLLSNNQKVYQYICENGPCSAKMVEYGTALDCNVVSSSINSLREKFGLIAHYMKGTMPCEITEYPVFYHIAVIQVKSEDKEAQS
jgi:hypothetical protein